MKQLVSLLVAYKHFAANTVIELEGDEAKKLIAEKKAVAVQFDPSLIQRDHAKPPPADDSNSAIVKAFEAAVAPLKQQIATLGERVEEVANKGPRTKSSKNMGKVRADTGVNDEPEVEVETDDDEVDPEDRRGEITLRDVVRELRSLRATKGIQYAGAEVEDGHGLKLARFIRAQAAAKVRGNITTDQVLEKWGYKGMAKLVRKATEESLAAMDVKTRANQLGQSSLADGGAIVPEQFSADLIPLLRNATRVRQAGARIITMSGGNLTVPKATGASTATYIGENQANNLSKPQLGDLKFVEKIMRVDVVLSNSLIQNAAISADAWVRDDMVAQAALKEDTQALFGKGTQYAPPGVENLLTSSRLVDMTAADRTAPTLQEVAAALTRQIKLIKQSNIITPLSRLGWIMNASMEAYLGGLVTTTGAYVYLDQLSQGMLRGYPTFITEQVPDNLSSFAGANADETRLFFGDWNTLVIAESAGGMSVMVFPNGTYEDGGTVYSGASRDQTYVRLMLKHDIGMRYNNTLSEFSWRPTR